jgi:hypothetical protein
MKKFLATFILCAGMGSCAVAHADGWRHGGGHYVYRPGYGWVFPTVVGGVIGYEIARNYPPQTVIIQQPPVVVNPSPPPAVVPPTPLPGYHWEAILDANCNCYRTVMVQN